MIRLFTYVAIVLGMAQSAHALSIVMNTCEQKNGASYEEYSGFGYDESFVGVIHLGKNLASKPRYQLLFCGVGQLLDIGEELNADQEQQLDTILYRALEAEKNYTLRQLAAAARKSGIPVSVRKIQSNNCVCNNWGYAAN